MLRNWIDERRSKARNNKTLAAGKYPQLCRLAPYLKDAVTGKLVVIHSQRPLEQSIASLVRRHPNMDPDVLTKHQRWLWEGKESFLATFPNKDCLTVEYASLLAEPREVAQQLADFLAINPAPEQLARAVESIEPAMQHVK